MTVPVPWPWEGLPVELLPLDRFVIPLHDLDPTALAEPYNPDAEPVLAHSRHHGWGPIEVSDGRHRLLRAAMAGATHHRGRLLVLP